VQNTLSAAKHPSVRPESTWNTLTLEDGRGKVQTLYFTSAPIGQSLEMYELPPLPPDGAFDVRFSSGRMLEVIDDERKGEFPILISSAHYPVTLHWDVRDLNSAAITIGGNTVPLTKVGSIQILSPESRVVLKTLGRSPLPREFSLGQNYPNPFNPTTRFEYGLPKDVHVRLRVFNTLGQLVATIVDNYEQAGWKSVEYDAVHVTSGIYFYRLEAGEFSAVRKMLIVR